MTTEILFALVALLALVSVVEGVMWVRCAKALKSSRAKIDALNEEMQSVRSLDEATGAYNYPFFVKMANLQIKLARRHKWPVSLMIVDIDQLETINLRYSFKTGDAVLKHLNDSIRSVVRTSDVLGRFGGSGIFILLPECDTENVATVKERIEEAIEATPLMQGEKRIDYRRSAGAVTMYGKQIHLNRMLGLAEDALAKAKEKRKELVIFDKEGGEV
ncbi:GGDEF domain-containing protein [Hydrogenimonas sp.]